MINRKSLIKLTQGLIRIDSQNPPGDERRIALFVKEYLQRLGLKVKIYEFKPRRSNVVAILKGQGRHSLLLTPHLDTVPSGTSWSFNPFSAKIIRERIYGLGATDCKCNLASLMEAIKSTVEDGRVLPYNLIFAATADEESGSALGLIPLLNRGILKPDVALVLDADDFQIITAQKGLMHLKVRIEGKKAHGAYPDLGINAIDAAVKVINRIKEKKFFYKKNKYLKLPTVNVGTIKGGDKVNVVADWCEFELDFRFLPGTDYRHLLSFLKSVLKKYSRRFKIEINGIQRPYTISEENPLVKYLKRAFVSTGITPKITGSEGATVVTFFKEKGIPAIATGFGVSSCAHAADEYASINNLYKGTLALDAFLKIYQP
ncbi:MAG: M20 family metallopeptidase [Candidatus Omnitrophica bacterium]|nr:M20 family metallopeptidase [Candidatus Omnitrophota bacterium]